MRCICILSAVLYLANCQHILTFHSNSSVARYAEGLYTDGRIRFQFRTGRAGTLLLVAAGGSQWVARLEGALVVREYQLINQSDSVLSAERRSKPQLFRDRWTLFSAKVTNQIISFQVSGEPPLVFPLKEHSNRFNWSLGSDNSSFIGCLRGLKLTNQSSVYPSAVNAVAIGDSCATKCNSHSCVHGRCLEFYDSAECDCSGTKFTGDRCHLETSSVSSLKYSFANQSDAALELAPWVYRPGGRLRFQFATIHTSLPLLTLSANQMRVSCSLNSDGQLTAELRSGGKLISQLLFSDLFLATNSWSTLLLSAEPAGLRVQVSARGLSQSAVLSGSQSADSLVLVLGRGAGGHFIGCMKGVKVSNGSAAPLVSVLPVRSAGVLIGRRCVDRCENVSCGAGRCVNGWSRHICDCSRTLQSGRFCSEPARQISLFGNETADFSLPHRPRLSALSLYFRSLSGGSLLSLRSSHSSHAAAGQSAVLKLQSADLQLVILGTRIKVSVKIGGTEHSINISGLLGSGYSAQNWNYVSVQFQSSSLIKIVVNGVLSTLTTELWEWNADRITVGREMIGCVSQLTVNRFEILSETHTGHRDICPTHKTLSVHIPYSQTRLHGLSIKEVRLRGRLVILQLEFLLGAGQGPRGVLFLSLPELELELSCGVTERGLELSSVQGSVASRINVRDGAWHKLELVLRSAGNRTLVRLSVDSHSESRVYVTGHFSKPDQLIGQLRIGDNNATSLGGCVRNAALFGHALSLGSLLSNQMSRYVTNSCPSLTPCDFSPCANGATCVPLGATSPRCACSGPYTGRFCTNTTDTAVPAPRQLLPFLLSGLLALSVLLAAAAALSVCLAVRQCDRGTGTYRTGEETGTTLMPDSLRRDSPAPAGQEWPV